MSASLVGSEMCIRDSEYPTSPAARGPTRGPNNPRRGRPAGPDMTEAPVSYTHLTLPTICSV
eukprot:9059745-Alexandrium_andersonii.AAC.1